MIDMGSLLEWKWNTTALSISTTDTQKEEGSVWDYINSISKDTGINFYDEIAKYNSPGTFIQEINSVDNVGYLKLCTWDIRT